MANNKNTILLSIDTDQDDKNNSKIIKIIKIIITKLKRNTIITPRLKNQEHETKIKITLHYFTILKTNNKPVRWKIR